MTSKNVSAIFQILFRSIFIESQDISYLLNSKHEKKDNTQRIKNPLHVFVEGYIFSNLQKFQRKLLKLGEYLREEKCKLWSTIDLRKCA